jgi:hypothetical protein
VAECGLDRYVCKESHGPGGPTTLDIAETIAVQMGASPTDRKWLRDAAADALRRLK